MLALASMYSKPRLPIYVAASTSSSRPARLAAALVAHRSLLARAAISASARYAADVPFRFRPFHASHPPLNPGTRPLYPRQGPRSFTDHCETSDGARNKPKVPFSPTSLVVHAPTPLCSLVVSERGRLKQQLFAHHLPATERLITTSSLMTTCCLPVHQPPVPVLHRL